ncbi:MAG: agmatine deiminase family protein [Cyclobacteriaceae bacterium]
MVRLPAEWEPQAFVQFTFPHEQGDWAPTYPAVVPCFVELITTVARFQKVLVVCDHVKRVKSYFTNTRNLHFAVAPSNDTWARDHGAITIVNNGKPELLDFQFNGWGNKFAAELDNQITATLDDTNAFGSTPLKSVDFVLEGGAIESDGAGTLLTTSNCLLAPTRNPHLSQKKIEKELKHYFGLDRVLWLEHGELAGDDTDAHIDTLARLCDEQTIAYVQCSDPSDEHFEELQAMEAQLKTFKTAAGNPYKLVPLPMADACYDEDGDRMPATYANFLICNGAVLVPIYRVAQDEQALETIRSIFPDREVIGINCLPLIQQHGSLHCVTMQYPAGVPLNA